MTTLIPAKACVEILRSHTKKNDLKFISSELKTISENLEGFVGEHYKLIIHYEENGEHKYNRFFVKNTPTNNKTKLDIADALGAYKKEIFVYEVLFKEFRKYGYDISFASNLYYTAPNETLVLEDVTLREYSVSERKVHFTENHLKCALKSLASFHAAGYALERTKSKELNRKFLLGEEYAEYSKECIFVQYIDENLFSMKWWIGCLRTLDAIIELLPQDDTYKREFRELIKNSEIGKSFAPNVKSKISKTCGHGDLWSNNFLFKYENNVPVKCILIDYQLFRYFYPSFDVLLAIFTNTDAAFRRSHMKELYLYYHRTLSDILNQYGYRAEAIHPLTDFYDSIKLIEVEAILQYFLAVTIIFLPELKADEDDSGVNEILFDNVKLAAEAFQNDTTYRDVMSDAVYELKNALIRRCRK